MARTSFAHDPVSGAARDPVSGGARDPVSGGARGRSRWLGILLATLIAVNLAVVGGGGGRAPPPPPPPPPPNPSDAQLAQAAARKAQAAKDVGRLSGLVAAIDAEVIHLDGLAELAKEKYLRALTELAKAELAATKAKADVLAARKGVDAARAKFKLYIAAAYMSRGDATSGLLTAADPSALLAQGDLSRYTSARQMTGIGALAQATVTMSNAEAAARVAVSRQTTLTTAADLAQEAAVEAVARAKTRRAELATQKAGYERQLVSAGEALTGLQNKRAAYRAWQIAEAKRKAAEAARRERERQRQIAAQAREQQRQERLAAQGNAPGPSGGGSSVGAGSFGSGNGIWTPAKGRAAANRALRWLGEPYSFAAGNFDGPTWGLCVTNDSGWNDCHVFGFDCSGLALYAWAPAGIYMDHYAATQYGYGRVHPSVDQLLPGDLMFWSSDGTRSGIHHVAIYVGNGNVVQAPQSGDVVKISPLWFAEYFGATRPGT